jgi:hypothetical protein
MVCVGANRGSADCVAITPATITTRFDTMKNRLLAVLALTLGATAATATHAADVGVSISVSQPGVYGRIDIGKFPQPQVIVTQPVVVVQPRVKVVQAPEPVYLWVPPGHQKNWRKHCYRYSACGTPVYFVKDDWYQQTVHRGEGREHHRHHGKGEGKGKGHKKDD